MGTKSLQKDWWVFDAEKYYYPLVLQHDWHRWLKDNLDFWASKCNHQVWPWSYRQISESVLETTRPKEHILHYTAGVYTAILVSLHLWWCNFWRWRLTRQKRTLFCRNASCWNNVKPQYCSSKSEDQVLARSKSLVIPHVQSSSETDARNNGRATGIPCPRHKWIWILDSQRPLD